MNARLTPPPDSSTRDLPVEWNLAEVPLPGPEDDSLFAPIRPVAPSPARKAPPPPPPEVESLAVPQPCDPPSDPSLCSDPFFDFRLDSGADPQSLNVQSLISPSRSPVAHPTPSGATILPAGDGLRPSSAPADPTRTVASLRPGDHVGGFCLVSELGRGAFARVFLAEQIDLGGRRVALKVSKAEGDEPLLLARLQHTHIVPIHSVHDDAATGLRLLCMPYLGGANLAQVLESVGGRTVPAAHRRSLVEALDEVSLRLQARTGVAPESRPAACPRLRSRCSASRAGSDRATSWRASVCTSGARSLAAGRAQLAGASSARGSQPRGNSLWSRLVWRASTRDAGPKLDDRDFDQPARQFLRHANRTQASVWIIARLAEGLEHAHSRGLLHRDLKPSNVLIAADGTPMLLDFNLSALAGPCDPTEGAKAMLGGTLPYMAPEHLDAFHPEIAGPVEAVDERSDIYSLGLIFFEMLAGEHPFPEPAPGTPLVEVIRHQTEARRHVPSLHAADPDTPWGLDAIARKCLDPVPERRYSRARDFSEDLGRFLDNLPLKHVPEPSLRERAAKWARRHPRFCNTASVSALAGVILVVLGVCLALASDLLQSQNARLKLQVFRSQFEESEFLLNIASGPAEHLQRGLDLARQTIEQVKLAKSGDLRPDSWVRRLAPTEQAELRRQAAELLMLEARARVGLIGRSSAEGTRREAYEWAVRWLDRAERLDPHPPSALFNLRAQYHAAMGQAEEAARDRAAAASRKPESARDFALIGTALLADGKPDDAELALLKALDLDPKDFWAHFALGHCRLARNRYLDAAGDFNACVVLEPKFAWPYFNRGFALARAGRLDEARQSYAHALHVNPRFAEAWVNLGLVELERNNLEAAERALDRAIDLDRATPSVLTAWAEVKSRRGNRATADRLFERLLHEHPDDADLLTARGVSLIATDPARARADLDRAIELNPRHSRAHYGMALLLRTSAPRDALKHAEAALAADHDMIDAVQLRAVVRARLGDLAAVADAERLAQVPTSHHLYNAACALALLVETAGQPRLASQALEYLARALDAGFPAPRAAADLDLKSLHTLAGYRSVIDRTRSSGQP